MATSKRVLITRLRGKTCEMPPEPGLGDIVVLANQDLFVWDQRFWRLLGGRTVPKVMLDGLLSYLASGWPDSCSDAEFDLGGVFDSGGDFIKENRPAAMIAADQRQLDRFKQRLMDTIAALGGR